MGKEIVIKTAELAVGHNDDVLQTGSIGSCLVVALYDPENKVGGLAHTMLPYNRKKSSTKSPAKYVPEGIDNLVADLEKIGGDKNNFVAKLVGGATMFKRLSGDHHSIGNKNIEIGREHLQELGIKVEKEDTGGGSGKMVDFHLDTGIVSVTTRL